MAVAWCIPRPGHGMVAQCCTRTGRSAPRLERSTALEAIADGLGVRYIAPNRPGFGGSDRAPGRTVLDFAADIRELTDALAISRFWVVGVSAGGPYALAIAHRLGARVSRAAVCSSLSPLCAPHQTPGMPLRIRVALAAIARAPDQCIGLGDQLIPLIQGGAIRGCSATSSRPTPRDRSAPGSRSPTSATRRAKLPHRRPSRAAAG